MKDDPQLAEDRQTDHRYQAARAAVLAAAGQGKDDPAPTDTEKLELRKQALQWLTAELDASTALLETLPAEQRPEILRGLGHWRGDKALVSVLEPFESLSAEERKQWSALGVISPR